jgi:outer membrane protein TolC
MRYFFAVMRFILTSIVVLLLVLLIVALEGCSVGPKYVKPTVPTTPAYKEEAPEQRTTQTWRSTPKAPRARSCTSQSSSRQPFDSIRLPRGQSRRASIKNQPPL